MILQSRSGRIYGLALASLFAALTAIGAFIRIPIPYVPLTLQTLFVLLAGVVLGSKTGALSQVIYLSVGLLGVPIFANGGGPGYVFQPSFGYLLSYPVSAFVVGAACNAIAKQWPSAPPAVPVVLACLLGTVVIYSIGVPFLYWNLNHVVGKPVTLATAIDIGLLVFLPGTAVKIVVCAYLGTRINRVFAGSHQEGHK